MNRTHRVKSLPPQILITFFGFSLFVLIILLVKKYSSVTESEIINIESLQNPENQNGLPLCPETPSDLQGEFSIDHKDEPLEIVEKRLSLLVPAGGWYVPKKCKARERIAIIVPVRNRASQLAIFLKNIHPMLMKQQIEYGIYVVEQTMDLDFNKGILLNAGFTEALKMKSWDCFIFHDIDMLPVDDRNIYNCPSDGPRHMVIGIDKYHNKLPWDGYFGGANAFTTEQFRKINGYSNLYWNKAGIENDLRKRVEESKLTMRRPSEEIARYTTTQSKTDLENKAIEYEKYIHTSGLNTLQYHIKKFKVRPTFVHIVIDRAPKEEPRIQKHNELKIIWRME